MELYTGVFSMDINIYILKYFIKVAQVGNITQAAEMLYISQPTLSRHIASLEKQLKVPLFERSKNGVKLTDAGQRFYYHSVKLISAYDEFMSKAFDFQDVLGGTLKIAHQKSSQELAIAFNKKFLKTYPGVNIRNWEQGQVNLLDELKNGKLDAVYIYQNEIGRRYRDLKYMFLGNMCNMLLVSKDNPLSKQEEVSLRDLWNQKFIIPSRFSSPYRNDEIITSCVYLGYEPTVVSDADSMLDIISDVVRFEGVAIVPYMHNIAGSGQVKFLKLLDFEEKYPVALCWKEDTGNFTLEAYVRFIRNLVEEMEEEYFYTPTSTASIW